MNVNVLRITIYCIMSNLFFRSLFVGVTAGRYPAARCRNVLFISPPMCNSMLRTAKTGFTTACTLKFIAAPMTNLWNMPIIHCNETPGQLSTIAPKRNAKIFLSLTFFTARPVQLRLRFICQLNAHYKVIGYLRK